MLFDQKSCLQVPAPVLLLAVPTALSPCQPWLCLLPQQPSVPPAAALAAFQGLLAGTSLGFGGLQCSGGEGSSPGREDEHHCGEGTTTAEHWCWAVSLLLIYGISLLCLPGVLVRGSEADLEAGYASFFHKTGLSGQHLPSSPEFVVIWAVSWHQHRGSGHCQLSPSLVFLVAFQYLIAFFMVLLRAAVSWRLSELLEVQDVSVNTSIQAPSWLD